MGKRLAIKGHPTRSEEVIKLLEMMGGKNFFGNIGNDDELFYYIDDKNNIDFDCTIWDINDSYTVFTLEEFLEKYPFKVGDFVRIPEYESEVRILKMKWCPVSEHIEYLVCPNDEEEWFTADELLEDNDNPTKMRDCKKCGLHFGSVRCFDKDCPHNAPKSYAVGLKDGKVIECGVNKEVVINEIKPLFKTGDVVKLKGCPDKNLFWIVVDVVEDGYIFNDGEKCPFDDQHHYEKSNREIINAIDITAKVVDKNHKMGPKSKLPSKYYEETITPVITTEVIDNSIDSVQFIQDGKIVAVHLNTQNYENEVELQLGDYEIEVRDGKTYAVLKKPKYPTTYAECCEVLVGRKPKPNEISFDKMELCLVDLDNTQSIDFRAPHLFQLNRLFRLLMCLDAYWKIAGEEMGLDKPWEPDWKDTKSVKYAITLYDNVITKMYLRNENAILVFPTEEMRDVFYKNFKHLIEQCKELL